jgi:hypothetical protein
MIKRQKTTVQMQMKSIQIGSSAIDELLDQIKQVKREIK